MRPDQTPNPAPPRPILAFQVGVTGHRALPHADLPAIQAAGAQLLRAIRAEIVRLHAADQAAPTPLYRPDPPALRVVCGLAEGADSILADAALAEGWSLVAALPFPCEEFARDFTDPPALARYQALLARAAAISELDGSRQRGGEPYAHIGQQIVEQSDLMLVIWDGLPPRGPGGTGDVVQQALDRGLPVAILPPTASPTLPPHVEWRNAGPLPTLLQAALLPPPDTAGFPHTYFTERPGGPPGPASPSVGSNARSSSPPPARPRVNPSPQPPRCARTPRPTATSSPRSTPPTVSPAITPPATAPPA